MKKKTDLVNKIKLLLKKSNAPMYLHKFGPKMYKLWHHVFALFVKEYCQFSYRRSSSFLRNLNYKVATKSTLQRYAKKLNLPFWQTILKHTLGRVTRIAAIDGTGMNRTNASWYYIKRTDGKSYQKGYKLSILSTKKKILSLRIRAKFAHDVKDVKYLLNKAKQKPKIVLMDRAYDAEWIHKFCNNKLGIRSIIPIKKNSSKGYFRRKLRKDFPKKTYNKRNYVESVFHAIKQKFGATIRSKLIHTARTQIYCRAILHNIFLSINMTWDITGF